MPGIASVFYLLFLALSPQDAREGTQGDAQKLVKIKRIEVEGSRFPGASVTRLAQIKTGDEMNFVKLHTALQNAIKSGLIANIEFEYESVPESTTDVILHLKCTDEKPSAAATIKLPKVNEDDVWTWLAQLDPLFTRQMPPTEAAVRLYADWIGKYMVEHGDPQFQQNFAIVADGASSTGGGKPDRLTFKAEKRRSLK